MSTPPSLAQSFAEASNPALQGRVQLGMAKIAQNVGSEDPATPGHAARESLAKQVSNNPALWTLPFTVMVCGQGITSVSDDTTIENMISAVWNTMAGVNA